MSRQENSSPLHDNKVPRPSDEQARLQTLADYNVLDTPPERAFDRVTELAARIFEVPVALVSLVDRDRQWFKSCIGLDVRQTDRKIAFCAHAIMSDAPMVVPDATADPRFRDNPLVTHAPHLRFYAGAPLCAGDGHKLGTLCIIDFEPRPALDAAELTTLTDLAAIVVDELEIRRSFMERAVIESELEAIFQTIPDAVVFADSDRKVMRVNEAFERLWGYEAAEVRGRRTDFLYAHHSSFEHAGQTRYNPDAPRRLDTQIVEYRRRDGSCFLGETSARKVLDENGQVLGYLGVIHDLTKVLNLQQQREAAEQRSRKHAHMLEETGRLAKVGGWELEPSSDTVWLSRQVQHLHHLDDTAELAVSTWLDYFDPSKRAALSSALDDALTFGRPFDLEVATASNPPRWMRLIARPQVINGEIQRVRGAIQDVTANKQAEQAKREFISVVSHELRTPLTSIRGALGLIAGGVVGELPAQAAELIDIAKKNSERLGALINDILDIEKIEAGKISLDLESVDPGKALVEVAEASRSYADKYDVTLVTRVSSNLAKLHLDAPKLHQILTNLLSNAVKFSPPGSDVILSASPLAQSPLAQSPLAQSPLAHRPVIRLAVRDFGPGIPQAFRERLFDKFSQADSSDSRKSDGTGLGLSIAKALTERMGGRIDFQTGEDGTTFFVDFPLARLDDVAFPSPHVRPIRLEQARFLVVEDDPEIGMLLRMMLEQQGAHVDLAANALQARDLIAREKFDAITVDLDLPDTDGLTLIRDLFREHDRRLPPIIVVSAHADDARDQVQGSALQIADWLSKPVDPDELVSTLAGLLQPRPDRLARLLYVEDDEDLCLLITRALSETAQVTCARTVADGKRLLRQEPFDLALLDMMLPDGSGLELLEALDSPPNLGVPVVVFSSAEVPDSLTHRISARLIKSRTSHTGLKRVLERLLTSSALSSMPRHNS